MIYALSAGTWAKVVITLVTYTFKIIAIDLLEVKMGSNLLTILMMESSIYDYLGL